MGKLGLGAAPKPQMMPGKKRIKKPGEVEKKVLQVKKIMFLKQENLMYVCRVLAREKNKGGGFYMYVIRGLARKVCL